MSGNNSVKNNTFSVPWDAFPVPEGGLAEFFLESGCEVFRVLDSTATNGNFSTAVDAAMQEARENGSGVIVVRQAMGAGRTLAYVLYVPHHLRRERK